MSNFFNKILKFISSINSYTMETHYLSQATDVADLERRLKTIQYNEQRLRLRG